MVNLSVWPVGYDVVAVVVDLINITACLVVVIRLLRKRRRGGRASSGMLRLVDTLILHLCCYYLVQDIFIILPTSVLFIFAYGKEDAQKWADWLLVITFPFQWPPAFFHTYIASICYNWLVKGHSVTRLKRGYPRALRFIFAAFLVQAFFEVIVFAIDRFIPFYDLRRWGHFTSIERLVVTAINLIVLCYFYGRTCATILSRFRARERVKKRHEAVVSRFLLINTIVVVTQIIWSTYLYLFYNGRIMNPIVAGLFLLWPSMLQPFYDAIVLGNLFQGCGRKGAKGLDGGGGGGGGADDHIPEPPAFRERNRSKHLSSVRYLESFAGRRSFKSPGSGLGGGGGGSGLGAGGRAATLFVTTFNMGPLKDPQKIGAQLADWIPLGYDVFAVGLQECSCVDELRQALHAHLGGPDAYLMYQAEVAPATLLYGSIALTVFARAGDVASGAFAAVGAETSRVRNGVNLVVGKAGNKGMTGLSFRYHDATLAFVTCHYASDSGGKKRLGQRNLDARRTLKEIRLTDDEGFDVSMQHHHTIVFGDMNYRMRLPARAVVERTVQTARALTGSVWQDEEISDYGIIGDAQDGEEDEDEQRRLGSSGGGGSEARVHLPSSSSSLGPGDAQSTASELAGNDGGPNFVMQAYLKLFAKEAALSYVSTKSSYVGTTTAAAAVDEEMGPPHSPPAHATGSMLVSVLEGEEDEDAASEDEEQQREEQQQPEPEGPTPSTSEGEAGGLERDASLDSVPPPPLGATSPPADEGGQRGSGALARLHSWLWAGWASSRKLGSDASSIGKANSSADVFSTFSSSSASNAFMSYVARPTSQSLWSWVADFDELYLEMKAGHVFAGFREGPITFPPSFRWRRSAKPGNYTSLERLCSSYVLQKKGDGERVPSYTDRILFHSMPDVQQQLQLVAYQMCDAITGSDHKPVSAAFNLLVNRDRIGFHTASGSMVSPQQLLSPERPLNMQAAVSTWSIQLFQPVYKPYRLKPSLAAAAATSGRGARDGSASPLPLSFMGRRSSLSMVPTGGPASMVRAPSSVAVALQPQPEWGVTVYFPCVLEDPFHQDIKVRALEEALAVDSGGDRGAERRARAESLKRSYEFSWEELRRGEGVAFSALVHPEVSRHALIRLTDGATEIGQGVICLRHAFLVSADGGAADERGSGRLRRFRLVNLMNLRGSGGAGGPASQPEGVEVLISSGGRAVGMLRLQLKIRRHKD